jgi:hypothetical protein
MELQLKNVSREGGDFCRYCPVFQIHGVDFPFRTLHSGLEQAVVELLLHCASSYRWLPRGF